MALQKLPKKPHEVGVAVALGIGPELAFDLVLEHLGSSEPKLKSMAYGALRALFIQSGWEPLEEVINKAKARVTTPQVIADMYLAAPATRETWQRLDNETKDVGTAYWKSIWRANTLVWDAEDLNYAVQRLISVRRSVHAVNWLTLRPMSHELVIRLLEAVPVDLAASPDLASSMDPYRIAELFKKLDQADDVTDDLIARLEVPYIKILDHYRPELALHREVTREPSLFADVISWAFTRADRQPEDGVDEKVREASCARRFQRALEIAITTWPDGRRHCGCRSALNLGE